MLAPFIVSSWVGALLTQMLFLGIVAASLIFLSAFGGSGLARTGRPSSGSRGSVAGNATTNGNTKGLDLGWSPYWGMLAGIVVAVLVGLIFGALASRSVSIFLMITLTYSVIADLGQVTDVSGFGRISGIPAQASSAGWRSSEPPLLRRPGRCSPRLRDAPLRRAHAV